MYNAKNIWGRVIACGVVLVASLSFGCSSGGTGQDPESTLNSAQPSENEGETSTLSFSMSKWMNAEGTDKVAVSGTFPNIVVSMDDRSRTNMHEQDFAHFSAQLTIDLASLETGLDVRNSNVKETFFEVAAFPSAVAVVSDLAPTGVSNVYTAKLELTVHGVTKQLPDTTVSLERVLHGWRVRTVNPITITSTDFGFGVAALLERCMHKGLDPTAQVQADIFVKE